jgi:hypothetical protein
MKQKMRTTRLRNRDATSNGAVDFSKVILQQV